MTTTSVKTIRQALVQLSRRDNFAVVNRPTFMAAGKAFAVVTRRYHTLGDALFMFRGRWVALYAAMIDHKDLTRSTRGVYLRYAYLTEEEFKQIDRQFLTDKLKIEVSNLPDW